MIHNDINKIVQFLEDERLNDINIYDNPVNWVECGIIATANSVVHVYSVLEKIKHTRFDNKKAIVDATSNNWIIAEYESCVIHIFTQEVREYYDLDQFWERSKK